MDSGCGFLSDEKVVGLGQAVGTGVSEVRQTALMCRRCWSVSWSLPGDGRIDCPVVSQPSSSFRRGGRHGWGKKRKEEISDK